MRRARLIVARTLIAVPLAALPAGCGQETPARPAPLAPVSNQAPIIMAQPITPSLGIDEVTTFVMRVEVRDADGDIVSLRASGCSLGDETPIDVHAGVATVIFQTSRNCGSTITLRAIDSRGNLATASLQFQHTRFESYYRLVMGEDFYDQPFFSVALQQSGTTITGTIRDAQNRTGIVDPHEPGGVDGEGRFRLRFKMNSGEDLEIAGKVIATGNDNFFGPALVATGASVSGRLSGHSFKLWREAAY